MIARTISSVLALTLGLGAANADELIIGSQIPLTGGLARVGVGMNEGIQVAAKVFNETHGQHTIKVITIDDESQPAKAVAAIEKLHSQGALAFTGGYGSNIIGPASDAAERLGKVYMTSGGVATELSHRGLKTFFRIVNAAGYAKAVAGLGDALDLQSFSLIYSTRESTQEVAKLLEEMWTAQGKKVTMHPFDPSIADFKPVLHKIKLQDRPDAIAMVGYENDYVGIIRAAKVLKPDVKAILGTWSLATPKMWQDFPDLVNYTYGTATLSYPAQFSTAEEQTFAEAYKEMFDKEPDYLGTFGYVQGLLLFNAVAEAYDAGTLDSGGVQDALRKAEHNTLIGKVIFDESGDNTNFAHRMAQHQDGSIAIVWPKENATSEAKFPAVPW
ncbi:branched-chain amino acid ABC transporter substrate-binding protein [Paracoccus sp. MKU1]|nr:branched-chain amino acid ABC transporter substrate-binding protein [Paracoccus sp. MKU1]